MPRAANTHAYTELSRAEPTHRAGYTDISFRFRVHRAEPSRADTHACVMRQWLPLTWNRFRVGPNPNYSRDFSKWLPDPDLNLRRVEQIRLLEERYLQQASEIQARVRVRV